MILVSFLRTFAPFRVDLGRDLSPLWFYCCKLRMLSFIVWVEGIVLLLNSLFFLLSFLYKALIGARMFPVFTLKQVGKSSQITGRCTRETHPNIVELIVFCKSNLLKAASGSCECWTTSAQESLIKRGMFSQRSFLPSSHQMWSNVLLMSTCLSSCLTGEGSERKKGSSTLSSTL